MRDQFLFFIYEMLRECDLDEVKGEGVFLFYFVFIIMNQQLIVDYVILEYLEGYYFYFGFFVIFVVEIKESLMEYVYIFVCYINEFEGDILI